MNSSVIRLDLVLRRRSLVAYSLGMAAYAVIIVALYPAFKNSAALDELTSKSAGLAALFGISGSLTSPTGWVNANIYANFFPLILLLLTIGYGAGLAGQEHDGHLELMLSLPVSRGQVIIQKLVALVAQAAVLSVVVFLCVLIGREFDLALPPWQLTTATLGVMLLGADFGFLALAISAATGHRGAALGVSAAAASTSYLISSMAPVVSWLKPARYISVFYWAVGNGQLDRGLSFVSFLILVGVGIVTGLVALVAFQRHDLSS